jgi:hypothetical protein
LKSAARDGDSAGRDTCLAGPSADCGASGWTIMSKAYDRAPTTPKHLLR